MSRVNAPLAKVVVFQPPHVARRRIIQCFRQALFKQALFRQA